ncbi:hypothetical protein LWI29_001632 [Acer saccharum]|uniref:BED-type domain-containing protein n=1 Tax=Acer saccharum TaxID=4024 RepID=A0AA39RAB1_ACESA|nr:hypothetical protein LWI29_001632 [Acer saccharum]
MYQAEFSTFCQSFIVILVREGVTVCNLKTDSNLEFGGPNRPKNAKGAQGSQEWPKAIWSSQSPFTTLVTTDQTRQQLTASRSHAHTSAPNLVVDQPSPPISHLCRSSSSSPNQSHHTAAHAVTPTPVHHTRSPRLVDDQPFRPVVADQPSSAVASIFSISHRKMNDDDVLPTNIVDSSSSKGDEAVGSGSLEVAPLKGNVKPLALGGKGRQTSDSWNHFTKYQDDGRMRARCKYCPKNYACDSNTNGTTNMNKHL